MCIVCLYDDFSVNAHSGESIDTEENDFSSPSLIGLVHGELFRIFDFALSQPC